jgi:hypothetical protein
MKIQQLKQLIREEIENISMPKKTQNTKFEELVSQLEAMALAGEIDNNDISGVAGRLQSARRKMFSGNKSPEKIKAAAAKGATTRKLDKVYQQVTGEVYRDYGLDGIENASAQFALEAGLYKDKNLQNKFYNDVKARFTKLASSQGFNAEEIKRFLETNLSKTQYMIDKN